jgi:hydroxymethylglutaryl-CoA lyase
VRLVEVGPRDGLQAEAVRLSVEERVSLIERLAACGLSVIECGSFVSARWVPAMVGSGEVLRRLRRRAGVRYCALTPNLRGLEEAMQAQASEVAGQKQRRRRSEWETRPLLPAVSSSSSPAVCCGVSVLQRE